MTSPASSQALSTATSPEIKVTPVDGEPGDLKLPQPANGSIAIGFEENDAPFSALSTSSETRNSSPPLYSEQQQSELKPGFKPQLRKAASGHGSFKIFKGLGSGGNRSTSGLFHRHGKSSAAQSLGSGNRSPTPKTSNVRAIFQKSTCPDLNSVNRALEELRLQSTSENDPFVQHLSKLQSEIRGAEQDCKKFLALAMQERDLKKYEVCRGLCIRIIHNQHSHANTKVYAYNILATQASPGQAEHFLNAATKLVNEEIPSSDKKKLLSVIAKLRIGANAKESKCKITRLNGASNGEGLHKVRVHPNDLRVQAALPEHSMGAITPKSEKILQWAAPPPERVDSA